MSHTAKRGRYWDRTSDPHNLVSNEGSGSTVTALKNN